MELFNKRVLLDCRGIALIFSILLIQNSFIYSQTSVTTGGDYHTATTWIVGAVPGTNNSTIVVDGPVNSAVGLVYNNNVSLTINSQDTLYVDGDLTFNNGADLVVNSGAVVIVRGNFVSNNNLALEAGAYLIVMGDFSLNNNSTVNSTVTPSQIFIGGEADWGNGSTGNVLDCSGSSYNSGCNYGNIADLIDDPIWSEIGENCSPVPSYYGGGEPSSNSPLTSGSTINLSANPNPGSGASFVAYAWTGPNSYSYTDNTDPLDPNTSISSADATMVGDYVFTAFTNEGCYLQDTTYVLVSDCCSGTNYFSKDNITGDWSDVNTWASPDEGWRPLPPPIDGSSTGSSQPLCINGTVTLNGSLTIRSTGYTVCDTLVITGNLDVGSFSIDVVANGVLIVLGDYIGTNGTSNNSGKVIIAGEVDENYTLTGGGDTYLFDDTPTGNFNGGFTSAGDENDLLANDPGLFDFFQSASCGTGISGGTIGSDESVCSGTNASEIINITPASPSGSISYAWYASVNSSDPATGTWNIVADSTREALAPGPLTQTTSFYRMATVGSGCTANSNVVTVTVNPLPSATITVNAALDSICDGGFTQMDIVFTAGTGPFDFTISDGTNPDAFTNISLNPYNHIPSNPQAWVDSGLPGTVYTFTILSITDANNCTSANQGGGKVTAFKIPETGSILHLDNSWSL